MARRPNWRSIKTHRNYTVDEAARALGVCKGTIWRWLAAGLPAITDQRPILILGSDLVEYIRARRAPKQKCRLHECFCFSCRAPRSPVFGAVEYHPITPTGGNMRALCEVCSTVMHKWVAADHLKALVTILDVTMMQAGEHISACSRGCPNTNFARRPQGHA